MAREVNIPLTPLIFFNLVMRLANDDREIHQLYSKVEPGVDTRVLHLYEHGIPVEQTTMRPISPFRRRMLELCVQEGLLTGTNIRSRTTGDLLSRNWHMTKKGLKWVKSVHAAHNL